MNWYQKYIIATDSLSHDYELLRDYGNESDQEISEARDFHNLEEKKEKDRIRKEKDKAIEKMMPRKKPTNPEGYDDIRLNERDLMTWMTSMMETETHPDAIRYTYKGRAYQYTVRHEDALMLKRQFARVAMKSRKPALMRQLKLLILHYASPVPKTPVVQPQQEKPEDWF
jgi:hypothetical protein